jgi:hypothetical protein
MLKNKWRKLVTGDEKKRVRDLIRERKKEPFYIRLIDKLAFTLGVINISMSQYFLLSRPQDFWRWYSLIIPLLMIVRTREFKKRKFDYFLFDFCYFVLVLTFIYLYFFNQSEILFNICYIFSNGIN